jgi:methanogenic corrinoid protein MtbC1
MSYTGFLSDAIETLALRPRAPSPYASKLLGVLTREVIPNLEPGSYQEPGHEPEILEELAASLGTRYPKVVATLTQLLLESRVADAQALIGAQERVPLPETTINLEILAKSAELLGLLWERDLCDFNAVTVGVMQLQHIMRTLSRHANDIESHSGHHHRILLAPTEGEDHTFGLCMLGDFLIRSGWDVAGGPGISRQETLAALARENFDIAGFTISDERWLPVLTETIAAARSESLNQGLRILVGGPLLRKQPSLAGTVGADGSASDAPAALRVARELVAPRSAMARQ